MTHEQQSKENVRRIHADNQAFIAEGLRREQAASTARVWDAVGVALRANAPQAPKPDPAAAAYASAKAAGLVAVLAPASPYHSPGVAMEQPRAEEPRVQVFKPQGVVKVFDAPVAVGA